MTIDGVERENRSVTLTDDQHEHFEEIVIGSVNEGRICHKKKF